MNPHPAPQVPGLSPAALESVDELALVERRITLGHLPLRLLCPASPSAVIERALEMQAAAARRAVAAPADLHLPYWADVWPAAVALGRTLLAMPLAGARVLELGGGVGLAGLAAARAGARVTITDREPVALAVARRNAALNGLEIETRVLDWHAEGPLAAFDWVIAADVLYEKYDVEPLAGLLARLVARGSRALIADPGRPHERHFTQAATALGARVTRRPTHFYWDGRARTVTLIELGARRRRRPRTQESGRS